MESELQMPHMGFQSAADGGSVFEAVGEFAEGGGGGFGVDAGDILKDAVVEETDHHGADHVVGLPGVNGFHELRIGRRLRSDTLPLL